MDAHWILEEHEKIVRAAQGNSPERLLIIATERITKQLEDYKNPNTENSIMHLYPEIHIGQTLEESIDINERRLFCSSHNSLQTCIYCNLCYQMCNALQYITNSETSSFI